MTPANKEHVQACLDLLQRAQTLINDAASKLSNVDGMSKEWVALNKPYELVKKNWHSIESKAYALRKRK